jgi:beta-galactosidase
MHRVRRLMFVTSLLLVCCSSRLNAELPLLGAQVWIEPGQTPEEIDAWFAQLQAAHMPVARIFVMWAYVQPARGRWDFSLYDAVFHSAEVHRVRIVATLTPSGLPLFLGGDGTQGLGIVKSDIQGLASDDYIRRVVRRYRSSPALDSWILLNEPGQAPNDSPRAKQQFGPWLRDHYSSLAAMNRAWGTDYPSFATLKLKASSNSWNPTSSIDWMTFWRQFQTEQLRSMAKVVRSEDPRHGIHLNPHALLSNLAGLSDDLPEWRSFLDTLGCSIHPAWHFGLLKKDQYVLGVSYINDLVAGSIEPKPYWVTELQGGNNISSGMYPMNPTADEIAQWTWTSIGSGASRVIFWLLNARREGVEAAEWSLLDFQQKPSARLDAASRVAATMEHHAEFFSLASPDRPPITLIESLSTMTYETAFAKMDYPGRGKNAQLLETLGIYDALARLGPPPAIKHFDDYDWDGTSEQPRVVILPDIRVLSSAQIDRLKHFVAHGNTLLITGLTGFYDPNGKAWPLAGFPLSQVTGASLKELSFVSNLYSERLSNPEASLPAHLWEGSIGPTDAAKIGTDYGVVTATDLRRPNRGRVIWIPSPIGLGAWLQNSQPLANYAGTVFSDIYKGLPFRFKDASHRCMLRVLRNNKSYATIITNGAEKPTHCTLEYTQQRRSEVLWGNPPSSSGTETEFSLQPKETSVLLWR